MKKNRFLYFSLSVLFAFTFMTNTNIFSAYSANINDYSSLFSTNSIGNAEDSTSYYDETTGTLTVIGSGTSISKNIGTPDSYTFVNTKIVGDFTFTASLENFNTLSSPKSKAGLIVRDDIINANANYYGVVIDTEHDAIRSYYRNYTTDSEKSGSSNLYQNFTSINSNIYIEISKKGNKFTSKVSFDPSFAPENTYSKNKSITLNDDITYLGFGVSNGSKSTQNVSATFKNIKIQQADTIIFDSNYTDSEVTPIPPTTDPDADSELTPQPPAEEETDKDEEEIIPTPPSLEENAPLLTYTDGSLVIDLVANSTITSSINVSDIPEATLIVALYDGNNKMISYKTAYYSNDSQVSDLLSLEFTLPDNIAGYSIKSFLWDNLNNLTPISNITAINS